MRIRPRSIPGHASSAVPVQVVESRPGQVALDLQVLEGALSLGPMVRGRGPPFVAAAEGGRQRRLLRQEDQRRGLPPAVRGAESHLSTWRRDHPERVAVALTGCGNLGMNRGVRARLGGRWLGASGPAGAAIAVDPSGRGLRTSEEAAPSGEAFVITGPRLVRDGLPALSAAPTFADPRHLLLFPFVEVAPGLRVDFGHDRLLGDPALYHRAVAGEPLALELVEELPESDEVQAPAVRRRIDPESLRRALLVKGYREADRVAERGRFRFLPEDGGIEIAWLPGIYPHHALALRAGGEVCSVLVGGEGNRAGVVLEELAADLAAAGFTEALLLDNGGDVALYDAEAERFLLRPCEADRRERWPLTACLVYHRPAGGR